MFWILTHIASSGSSTKFGWIIAFINIIAMSIAKFWTKTEIFISGNPMPKKHDRVLPGDELWKLALFYPTRKLRSYELNGEPFKEVNLWFGLFRCVRFYISVQQEAVEKTVFIIRGKRAARRVKKAAIDAFGSPNKHINPVDTLVWSNIRGFIVRISPTIYEVCSRRKRKPTKRKDKK